MNLYNRLKHWFLRLLHIGEPIKVHTYSGPTTEAQYVSGELSPLQVWHETDRERFLNGNW